MTYTKKIAPLLFRLYFLNGKTKFPHPHFFNTLNVDFTP